MFAATFAAAGLAGLFTGFGTDPWLLVGTALGALVMFAAGLWDDPRGLAPRQRLLAPLLAASVVCLFGFRIGAVSPGVPLWGITNALNLIDGLDGLATGIATVAPGSTLSSALLLGRGDAWGAWRRRCWRRCSAFFATTSIRAHLSR